LRVSGFAPGAGQVQVASVPAGTRSRQLYVDGRRATRARGPESPAGYALTSTGFSLGNPAILSWPDRTGLEVVGLTEWKNFRCGVAQVSSTDLVLAQP